MKKLEQVIDFIEDFMRWSSRREDIRALGLAGSYARKTAKEDSDVDLIIIVDDTSNYLEDTEWTRDFGVVIAKEIEKHGKLTSLRVWYESGLEIEYGFIRREWITPPLNKGTKHIIKNGLRVLFEKETLLSPHDNIGKDIQKTT